MTLDQNGADQGNAHYVDTFVPIDGLPNAGNGSTQVISEDYSAFYDLVSKTMALENLPISLSALKSSADVVVQGWKVARIGTGVSFGVAGIGFITDFGAFVNKDIPFSKFLVNQGASTLGILGGFEGGILSGIYFGVDNFYPGSHGASGWNGVIRDLAIWQDSFVDHSHDYQGNNQGIEDVPGFIR